MIMLSTLLAMLAIAVGLAACLIGLVERRSYPHPQLAVLCMVLGVVALLLLQP